MDGDYYLKIVTLFGFFLYIFAIFIGKYTKISKDNINSFNRIKRYVRILFYMSACLFLVKFWGWSFYWIPSSSMLPNLIIGDVVLASHHHYGLREPINNEILIKYNLPQRGDIIVFYPPIKEKELFVKRVIGLPGDTISVLDNTWYVNGSPLEYKNLIKDRWAESNEDTTQIILFNDKSDKNTAFINKWVIPENYVFVLGDNRDKSEDSRVWGIVDINQIVGKVLFVAFNMTDKKEIFPIRPK
jgi:signal peptidase I